MKKLNLVGQRFGRWTVLYEAPKTRNKQGHSVIKWNVVCDCGKQKQIRTSNLVGRRSTSCGCKLGEWSRAHTGENSTNWKGGVIYDEYGYKLIRIPSHHRAKSNGYVREHIVVMEKWLGRKLLSEEQVHHLNNVKDDNRIENLELWSKSQPSGARIKDLVKWAKEILETYGKPKGRKEAPCTRSNSDAGASVAG